MCIRDRCHGLLQRQKEYGCTASAVRNSGMSLQERCRKLLMEGEADERSRQGRPGGIAHQIYGCVYLEEYSLLIDVYKRQDYRRRTG